MFGNRRNYDDIFRAFEEMFSKFDSPNGEWKTQTKLSDDGTYRITSYYYGNNKDEKTSSKNLHQQLDEAIENEDFERAVKLRDQIKKFESNKKEIEELELELKKSIKEQNFERSIEIRDLLKKLK
jgi:protein-arginine kinase activator protein McsA